MTLGKNQHRPFPLGKGMLIPDALNATPVPQLALSFSFSHATSLTRYHWLKLEERLSALNFL